MADPLQVFEGCLRFKGCISSVAKTVDEEKECLRRKNCRMALAYGKINEETATDDEIVLELYGKSDGFYKYIAMGLSTSGGMVSHDKLWLW